MQAGHPPEEVEEAVRQMERAGDALEGEWSGRGDGGGGQGGWEEPSVWDHRAVYPFTRTVGGGFRASESRGALIVVWRNICFRGFTSEFAVTSHHQHTHAWGCFSHGLVSKVFSVACISPLPQRTCKA